MFVILDVQHTQTVRRKRAAKFGINASIAMNLEPKSSKQKSYPVVFTTEFGELNNDLIYMQEREKRETAKTDKQK